MIFRRQIGDIVGWLLCIAIVAAMAFAAVGCSSTQYTHSDLVIEVVRFRPGYSGLTHRICSMKKWNGDCEKWDVIEYQIRNQEGRMRFISLGFICMVGGRRFKLNPDLPELVRYADVDQGWFKPKASEIVERLDFVHGLQALIDAGTYCYSERTYPDGIPFQ